MSETKTGRNSVRPPAKLLLRSFVVAASICVLAVIALQIYLGTTQAAALLAGKLTAYLHQPVRIAGLQTVGGAIRLSGVSLANPPDLPAGNLVSVESIVIAPDWGALLTGRRTLRSVSLEGLRLELLKNSAGVWNFSGLQRLFSQQKTAGPELLIEQLVVKAGVVQLNGRGVQGISFRLFNLATKGSRDAGLSLSFEDGVRNSYTVSGTTRPGPSPAFDLTLAAPALSLNRLAGLLLLKNSPAPEESNGSLQLTAVLQDGRLRAEGRLDFSRLLVPLPHGPFPLTGSITAAAAYTLSTDELSLESLTLTADNLLKVHAAGTVAGLKSERRFAVAAGIDELNLAVLTALLPEEERRKTAVGGTLRSSGLRFSGTGSQGVSSAAGLFLLQDASLRRGGEPIFTALSSRVTLLGTADGFLAAGTLSQGRAGAASLLGALQAPFTLHLSRQLKLLKAAIPTLTATVSGLGANGSLGYNAAAAVPFTGELRIPAARLSALQPLAEKLQLKIASGSGSLALKAAGRGSRDFTATATATVAAVRGVRAGSSFGIGSGVVDARFSRSSGQLEARGNAALSGLYLDKREGGASFSYRLAAGEVFLDNATFSFGNLSAVIARLKAVVPRKETAFGTVRYPLAVEVDGAAIGQGQAELNGITGSLRGSYLADPNGRWLEGTAAAAIARAAWQGKAVASPAVQLTFSRSGGAGSVSGRLLEGALSGELGFDPLNLPAGGRFRFGIRGGRLANLGTLLPPGGAVALTGGTIDGTLSGSYSRGAGLACGFQAEGADIAVTGSGGRSLLGGGGLTLAGGISGSRLLVDRAALSAGKEAALQLKGAVTNPLSPRREGELVFTLPRTPLNSIIDPLVNILPRLIQEATVDGSLAADGRLVLHDGRQLLEGALQLEDVLLEVPSQQLKAGAVNGRIPFSFQLTGDTPVQIQPAASFSRDNYPGLLQKLTAASESGQSVTIGGAAFGSLNLGEVRLQLSAGNGVTRIDSLRSSLYEGVLLGSGMVAVNKGLSYRADLLINGLSLKQFCATIPKIKNYISGRLDGVISLSGGGKNMAGLSGFTDLWVREGGGEKMLVSKDFLQKLSGKKISGVFFSTDRPYDRAEIAAVLEDGYLSFDRLDIVNTNLFGVRDLSVTIAPEQNRIALDHLFTAVKQAADRGKGAGGGTVPAAEQKFQWQE